MTCQGMLKRGGFTLIEVIVSIVITAILASLLVVVMGKPVTKSPDPVLTLRSAYDIQRVIENMAANTNTLSFLQASVGAEGSSQSNQYGVYEVLNNRLINFGGATNATEAAGGTNILKITIRNAGGDRVTRLFCQ